MTTENKHKLTLQRTDSADPDFRVLEPQLDAELAIRDGDDKDFYAQYNKSDTIRHIIVAYLDDVAAGCGAYKEYDGGTVEIKRMYVLPEYRSRGIAVKVLEELEDWARETGYKACILETGKKQPEAIALYHKMGYHLIPNYGQYAGVDNSVCMQKSIA